MKIEPFDGDYEALSSLYGSGPEELRARDLGRRNGERWLLRDNVGRIRAACITFERPDDRLFVSTVGGSGDDRAQLATYVRTGVDEPVHVSLGGHENDFLKALLSQGFAVEMEMERFRVRFDKALNVLDRAWLPGGFGFISAADADLRKLFEVDNRLRSLVPGTEGWRGDFEWFQEEITEDDAFDPSGYLVAVEESSIHYVGIVRVWRNQTGPRLGFVGVDPRFRRLPLGPALLRVALSNASVWGSETFETETALTNRVVHPRLARLADESLGRIIQMRLV